MGKNGKKQRHQHKPNRRRSYYLSQEDDDDYNEYYKENSPSSALSHVASEEEEEEEEEEEVLFAESYLQKFFLMYIGGRAPVHLQEDFCGTALLREQTAHRFSHWLFSCPACSFTTDLEDALHIYWLNFWLQLAFYVIDIFLFLMLKMGGRDEVALDRLSLVTQLMKHIYVRASGGRTTASEFGQFSPIFVWLLRDSYLDLVEDKRRITLRDYLELALRPVQGSGRNIAAKNEVTILVVVFACFRGIIRRSISSICAVSILRLFWNAGNRSFPYDVPGAQTEELEEWMRKIEAVGGNVIAKVKKDAEKRKARRMKIPIVREDYLVDCFKKQKKLPFDLYKVEAMGEASMVTVKVKGRNAVHESSGMRDSGHILENGKSIYNTTLSLSDLSTGVNSYYDLQIIQDDKGSDCYVFRKWGRVGNDKIGGNKLEGMSKSDAIREFKRLFLEKTENPWEAWEQKQKFEKQPGRFFPLDIDYGVHKQVSQRESQNVANSQLAPPVLELIKMLFNVETYRAAMMEFEINMSEMPLGKLSRSNIQK
ncbi:Guanylate-binding protein, N-terminal, partial [Dillenia turbinata]